MPRVEIATEITPDVVAAFERLIPQLSSSNPPPSAAELEEIVASPATVLFLGYGDDGTILGTLTLVVFRIPTGLRAWIEDVVVDGAARGMGLGELLNREALDEARRMGVVTVDLTSRPSREPANRLYQRIGFKVRTTNVYRYDL